MVSSIITGTVALAQSAANGKRIAKIEEEATKIRNEMNDVTKTMKNLKQLERNNAETVKQRSQHRKFRSKTSQTIQTGQTKMYKAILSLIFQFEIKSIF